MDGLRRRSRTARSSLTVARSSALERRTGSRYRRASRSATVDVGSVEERLPQRLALAAIEESCCPGVGIAEKRSLGIGLLQRRHEPLVGAEIVVVEHPHELTKVDVGHG